MPKPSRAYAMAPIRSLQSSGQSSIKLWRRVQATTGNRKHHKQISKQDLAVKEANQFSSAMHPPQTIDYQLEKDVLVDPPNRLTLRTVGTRKFTSRGNVVPQLRMICTMPLRHNEIRNEKAVIRCRNMREKTLDNSRRLRRWKGGEGCFGKETGLVLAR
jgi:hypothetical protein